MRPPAAKVIQMELYARNFPEAFCALTDHSPLRWQQRLFDRFVAGGGIPQICDVPTGLGKTSVIPIWLIALAEQAQAGQVTLPRRLIYIVNRRTVVDQATTVVEQLRERLYTPDDLRWSQHSEVLLKLATSLRMLSSEAGDELFLGISTLRGELADNEEWKMDPARAAIVVGTIDMVGSKLLFTGYGDGRYWRAQHAGLIGQDCLLVHDEAHLVPAFSDLLAQVAELQRQASEPRPIHVMNLSATSRATKQDVFRLEPEDEQDPIVNERLHARKNLYLHEVSEEVKDDVVARLVDLALKFGDQKAKVLLYVRSPETVKKVLSLLKRNFKSRVEEKIAVLTGTIRGYERDRLVKENPIYHAFLDSSAVVEETIYLVCTSAGEVGIDLDADHIVCDLTTLDSMIQRLGRVNRRGQSTTEAQVHVITDPFGKSKKSPTQLNEAIRQTGKVLQSLGATEEQAVDCSPNAVSRWIQQLPIHKREDSFTPQPEQVPLSDIVLDAWSLTSVSEELPGRPEVASYLHGLTVDLPQTYLVWRKELKFLDDAKVDTSTLQEWFLACRIEAHERLRGRSDNVQKNLRKLLNAWVKKDSGKNFPVAVLTERGEALWTKLSKVVENKLAYQTIVLPVEVGGLNQQGMLDPNELTAAQDVADLTGKRKRQLQTFQNGDLIEDEPLVTSQQDDSAKDVKLDKHYQVPLLLAGEGDELGETRYLTLKVEPTQSMLRNPETAKDRQTLAEHSLRIVQRMKQTCQALSLPKSIQEALCFAAERHDWGKDRAVWQRFACNANRLEPLAKSKKYLHGRELNGYRHEFGSLLQAMDEDIATNHAESDLILHLIAAHHDWARPHFKTIAFDHEHTTTANENAVAETMRRFGRLQLRFGHWGLAWLEALLRCSDIAASQPETKDKMKAAKVHEAAL